MELPLELVPELELVMERIVVELELERMFAVELELVMEHIAVGPVLVLELVLD